MGIAELKTIKKRSYLLKCPVCIMQLKMFCFLTVYLGDNVGGSNTLCVSLYTSTFEIIWFYCGHIIWTSYNQLQKGTFVLLYTIRPEALPPTGTVSIKIQLGTLNSMFIPVGHSKAWLYMTGHTHIARCQVSTT